MTDTITVRLEDEDRSELATAIDELEARRAPTDAETPRPDVLPLSSITVREEIFQPRGGISERHVAELKRAVLVDKKLEPLLVTVIGGRYVLVDGHHRLYAYQQAKTDKPVSVRYFHGTVSEAVLEAGKANHRVKLPMENVERQDLAWRLVCAQRYSKKQIHEASGVSERQIGYMREALASLGPRAYEEKSWWKARALWKGQDIESDLDDRDQWVEEQAQVYADRLAKEFSTKLSTNIEVGARALEIYFERKLPDLLAEWPDHVRAAAERLACEQNDDF